MRKTLFSKTKSKVGLKLVENGLKLQLLPNHNNFKSFCLSHFESISKVFKNVIQDILMKKAGIFRICSEHVAQEKSESARRRPPVANAR